MNTNVVADVAEIDSAIKKNVKNEPASLLREQATK